MPSHSRASTSSSSSSGRQSTFDSPPHSHTGSSRRDRPAVTFVDPVDSPEDVEERLRDELKRAYTELNKTREEKDRIQSASDLLKSQLQAQIQSFQTEKARLNELVLQSEADYDALKHEHQDWIQKYRTLETNYGTLYESWSALTSPSAPGSKASSSTQDNAKEGRSSKKDRDDRGRGRDRDGEE
jgi:chromosome segregation ATPase